MARSGFTLHAALLAATILCAGGAFTAPAMAGGKAYVEPCPADCVCGGLERPRQRFVNTQESAGYTEEYVEEYFHASSSHTSYGYEHTGYYDGGAYGGGEAIGVDGDYRSHAEHYEHRVSHAYAGSHAYTGHSEERTHDRHDGYASYDDEGGYGGYGGDYYSEEDYIERNETANLNNFQVGAEPGEPPQY